MDKVDIVLASYNGEKYLAQQLDSIIAQTYSNWRLLISDDGSSDKTLSIIEKYTKADERIFLVNKNRQGGVVKNFSKALEFATAEYIMFSDQDDYWLPQKIFHLKEILDEKKKLFGNVPMLIFTDLIIVDENLKTLSESFFTKTKLNPLNNFDARFLLWRSTVYGCSIMFNKSLFDVASPLPHYVNMHDQWYALMANLKGYIFFSQKSHVLYRQHDKNVIGAKEKKLLARLRGLFHSINRIKKSAYSTKEIAVQIFGEQEKSFLARIRFVRKNVIPYFYFAKIYALFFIYFYISNREN